MKCGEFLRAIHLCLDDELSIMRRLQMRRHVTWCKPCRRIMDSEAGLTSLLAADALEDSAPAGLRARILEQISEEGSPFPEVRSSPRHLTLLPASLLAAGFVGLLVAATVLTQDTGEPLPSAVAQVIFEHRLYGEERKQALEMTTSDPSRMAEWFASRLGFPLELPLVDGSDQRLVGGRVSSLAGRPAAYLLYEWRGHSISLIVANTMPPDLFRGRAQFVDGVALRSSGRRGVTVVWWAEEDEGRVYAAASQSTLHTVVEFARRCVQSPRILAREKST